MHDRSRAARRHWAVYLLAAACVAALVAAVLVVGPPSAASRTSERIVTVARGVVQSTVSGTGTVSAARQLDVNFETGGTLTHVYVHPGQRVVEGQALAAIDPSDAQATLDQAQASLAAAEAATVASASSASATTAAVSASAATATTPATTTPATTTTPTPPTTTTTTTTPSSTAPAGGSASGQSRSSGRGSSGASGGGSGSSASAGGGGTSGGGSGGGESAAQKAANVASAQAAVDRAQAALDATTLRAPMTGVVASVGASVGEQVSGGGSASASASSSGSSGSGSGGSGSGGSGGSGSSAFVVLADLDAMNVVVPFSESDVGKLRVGQPATVTVNALPNQELAAHVVSIATLPTSSSGVVSYDVTLRLDQLASGLKPGMTATAQVVVESVGNALNVASAAISGRGANASVTLVQGARRVRRAVVTGVVGDSTTQLLGGVRAGDQVAIVTQLPSATSSASGLGAGGAGAGGGGFGGGGLRRGGGGFGGGGGGGLVVGVGPGGPG